MAWVLDAPTGILKNPARSADLGAIFGRTVWNNSTPAWEYGAVRRVTPLRKFDEHCPEALVLLAQLLWLHQRRPWSDPFELRATVLSNFNGPAFITWYSPELDAEFLRNGPPLLDIDPLDACAKMFGSGFNPFVAGAGQMAGLDSALTPIDCSLGAGAPPTWAGREERVEWCLHNLTQGEKAFLYRMLHAQGIHLADCRTLEDTEKKGLK